MKRFFVSKSDEAKVSFAQKSIDEAKPKRVFLICETERLPVFKTLGATCIGFKDLHKAENWIDFVNAVEDDAMLIVDNIVKFVFFADGRKAHLTHLTQQLKKVVVMDCVPFFDDPAQIFYPLYFLGKDILGYNSYSAFQANHFEELADGSLALSQSFEALRPKLEGVYFQDYDCFFERLQFVKFKMSDSEIVHYNSEKQKHSENFTNPILLYRQVSTAINVIESRFECVRSLISGLKGSFAIVINYAPNIKKYKTIIGDYYYLTFNSSLDEFEEYENIVFLKLPITKPHNIFYILKANCNFYQLVADENNLDKYFFDKIYNSELRNEFDRFFSTKKITQ